MQQQQRPGSSSGGGGFEPPTNAATLAAVPPLALEAVAARLYPCARSLAALAATCRAARELVDSLELWEAWVTRRFGADTLPPAPLEAPVRAPDVEGFLFVQGMAPRAKPARALPPAPAAELGRAAAAAGARAYSADGAIYTDALPPPDEWRRTSLDPRKGLYVAASEARALGLADHLGRRSSDGGGGGASGSGRGGVASSSSGGGGGGEPVPPNGAAAAWPPPGAGGNEWLYFPGVDVGEPLNSDGGVSLMAEVASVDELLRRAAATPACVAVTTAGVALRDGALRPAAAWRARSDWATGVWVRRALAPRIGARPAAALAPAERAAALKRLYVRRAALAVEAAELDAAWLNWSYLALVRDSARPPPAGLRAADAGPYADVALQLRNVCWLDVAGRVPGVLAGDYEVAWCASLARVFVAAGDVVTLSAAVEPLAAAGGPDQRQGRQQRQQQQGEGQVEQEASAAAAAAGPGPACEVHLTLHDLQAAEAAAMRAGQQWVWVRGGVLHVPEAAAPAAVRVRWAAHSDNWKSGMRWAFAQLLPVAPGEARAELPPLGPPARAAARPSSGDGRAAAAAAAGGAAAAAAHAGASSSEDAFDDEDEDEGEGVAGGGGGGCTIM